MTDENRQPAHHKGGKDAAKKKASREPLVNPYVSGTFRAVDVTTEGRDPRHVKPRAQEDRPVSEGTNYVSLSSHDIAAKKRKPWKTALLAVGVILLVAVFAVACYAGYVVFSYHRVADNLALDIDAPTGGAVSQTLGTGSTYTITTYNVGFGAYLPDFSFFMDGGESSRAASEASCTQAVRDAATYILQQQPTIALFQELDIDADRSYHVDEYRLARSVMSAYCSDFAVNYDSAYLFYPLLEPIGASKSGLATFSSIQITNALRRSLPMQSDLSKVAELDRCYTVSRIPVTGNKELVVYNVHLIAYSKTGTIRQEQIDMLMSDISDEIAAGNYVICGGDFNSELRDANAPVDASWAEPFPRSSLPAGAHMAIDLLSDGQRAALSDSNRDAGVTWTSGDDETFMLDGFIISDNVQMADYSVLDNGFSYSDHMPVRMTFSLK